MASCLSCGKSGFGFLEIKGGECPACRKAKAETEAARTPQEKQQRQSAVSNMVITTEAWVGEVERLGVVASEVVIGMNIFKDVLANLRDVFGGSSGIVQHTLAEARQAAFEELKIQAVELRADAVIAVDIAYHTISTGSGANMMMVAVSGTAVKIK